MTYPVPAGRQGHAAVGVVTIIDEEFDAVRTSLHVDTEIAGTQYYGRKKTAAGNWDVVLGQPPARSNLPCGGFVGELIEDFRPHLLLLVGIAGGLCDNGKGRDGLELGDVVIAESVSYIEFLKITPKGVFYRHYPMDQPSVPLGNAISQQIKRSFDIAGAIGPSSSMPDVTPKIRLGEIVSGEKILGGDGMDQFQTTLLRPFDKALAVDMESVGMARTVCERRTSHWYNPRFAVIRGISDLVGADNNTVTRDAWKSYAAHSAAVVAAEFVARFGALAP